MNPTDSASPPSSDAWFLTTHWSVVLEAGQGSGSPQARAALEKLCRTYWKPLYAYVRRQGKSPEDAADLTQAFFERLLAHESLQSVHPRKGRFRSFLLAAMNHFLADEWDKARAQKRGADRLVQLELAGAEAMEIASPDLSPEEAYERQWALTLLEEVYRRLGAEYEAQGKVDLFEALRRTLAGSREVQPYKELAVRLGLQEGAVRVAVHRLRKRYREILRLAIADTVSDTGEVEDEFRYLLEVLGRV